MKIPKLTPVGELPDKSPHTGGPGYFNWQLAIGMIAGNGWHRIDDEVKRATLASLVKRVPGFQTASRQGRSYIRFDPPEQS